MARSVTPHTQAWPHAVKGALFVALGAICVGFAPIGLRLSEMGPQATGFWRFIFALPFLVGFAQARRMPIGPPHAPSLAVGAFFGLDITLWHAALTQTSVANATFLVNLGSIAAGLIAWWVLRQKPGAAWPLAATCALGGAAAMSFGAGESGSGALRGDVVAIMAACALSGYFIMMNIARRTANAVSVLIWATVAAIIVLGASSLVQGEALWPRELHHFIWPLSLALISHVVGQGLIMQGGGLAPPSIVGVVVMIQPVVAGLIAWPLFKEPLSAIQLCGAALILIGVWLAGRR